MDITSASQWLTDVLSTHSLVLPLTWLRPKASSWAVAPGWTRVFRHCSPLDLELLSILQGFLVSWLGLPGTC